MPGKRVREMRNILRRIDRRELVASVVVLAVLVTVPVWVWWRSHSFETTYPKDVKVFNITGIGSQGRWTLEEVSAFNYWWKAFQRAEIHVEPGDSVVLRLQSADVTHVFYAPTLNVGPVTIEPGRVEVVGFRAVGAGIHYYYCMSICGDCHYFMRGSIAIGTIVETAGSPLQTADLCLRHTPEPPGLTLAAHGEYLFQRMGCVACHGERGKGKIPNSNYVKKTVPQLNRLFETLSMSGKGDAEKLWKLIEIGKSPEQLQEMPTEIRRQRIVLSKYQAVRDVIKEGRTPARADTVSFVPPLAMPAWGDKLSERDIDAVLVYLLQNQEWEEAAQ